jgi:hypothetical protein
MTPSNPLPTPNAVVAAVRGAGPSFITVHSLCNFFEIGPSRQPFYDILNALIDEGRLLLCSFVPERGHGMYVGLATDENRRIAEEPPQD